MKVSAMQYRLLLVLVAMALVMTVAVAMRSDAYRRESEALAPLQIYSTTTSVSSGWKEWNPADVVIMGSGAEALVTLRPDGSIVYGEHYTPDAAAKALWDAVGWRESRGYRDRLPVLRWPR